ncbi:MAG: HAMP domain-containing sensor histidine kinase [Verrucomicrobiota bacterium]
MSIRTRLTLWYAGVMFVSLVAMGILSYHAFAPEPPAAGPSKPDEADENDLGEIYRIIFWCGVPATLLALGGGWWMMRRALAPVSALTRAAERVNEHNLGTPLPRTGNGDELDRLTEVFNAMTGRLGQSFARMREFTLHASHELKTPLTVMHGELETALRNQSLDASQRERLESELDEVQRLVKIVDGLTLLTKADAGLITLAREPVRLDELVREACADAQSLARPHDILVSITACEELTVTGDRHRLRQLLLNLTDNAIKYNTRKGTVTLSLRRADQAAEVAIANSGPGIPGEILPRIFDPFFRGDSSHSQAVEGCGLGLSIALWIITAHGGSIRITSAPNQLTTTIVQFPLQSSGGTRDQG